MLLAYGTKLHRPTTVAATFAVIYAPIGCMTGSYRPMNKQYVVIVFLTSDLLNDQVLRMLLRGVAFHQVACVRRLSESVCASVCLSLSAVN